MIRRGAVQFGPLEGDISAIINGRSTAEPSNINDWFSFCILHATLWLVWLQRNQRIFNNTHTTAKVIARQASRMVISWLTAHHKVDKNLSAVWLRECLSRM
ncbi:unnamed protein product [Linum trigynum]|uniref:Uncharacterized protein n=1 Tax=Linum trigynum TaxID=586398 RepID=A0AAV2FIF1_9ROSI